MVVNELGEWEFGSEEEDAPRYDEEIENDENEIQPKKVMINALFLGKCLVLLL